MRVCVCHRALLLFVQGSLRCNWENIEDKVLVLSYIVHASATITRLVRVAVNKLHLSCVWCCIGSSF